MDDSQLTGTGRDSLPAVPGQPPGAAVESARLLSPPPFAGDLVRTITQASEAVSVVSTLGPNSDVTVSAFTALVCAGSTAADALQAAADLAKAAPTLEIHALAWARVPGPVEGVWEWQLTMTVSSRDETGEYGGATHQADRRR